MSDTAAPAIFPNADALPELAGLPDPFLMADGTRVASKEDWTQRRAEILAMLLHYEYGHVPPPPTNLRVSDLSETLIFDGTAVETRLTLSFGPGEKGRMTAGLIAPASGKGPFPVILAMWKVGSALLAGNTSFEVMEEIGDVIRSGIPTIKTLTRAPCRDAVPGRPRWPPQPLRPTQPSTHR